MSAANLFSAGRMCERPFQKLKCMMARAEAGRMGGRFGSVLGKSLVRGADVGLYLV